MCGLILKYDVQVLMRVEINNKITEEGEGIIEKVQCWCGKEWGLDFLNNLSLMRNL